MKLSEFSHTVTSLFREVYRFRVQEWSLIEPERLKNNKPHSVDKDQVEWYRLQQAQAYAELELYKTSDLYSVLQEVFDTGYKGETFVAFAAYIVNERGMPNPMVEEPAFISQELHQWLFANQKQFANYDFSFENFEEAFKESCWRGWCESRLTLV